MNPGKYQDLIIVQTAGTEIGDSYEQTPIYTDGPQFWAEVKLLGGFEIAENMIMRGQNQYRVRCEWNPIAAGLKTDQRLKLAHRDNAILNITSMPEDIDGNRGRIEFVAERLEHD